MRAVTVRVVTVVVQVLLVVLAVGSVALGHETASSITPVVDGFTADGAAVEVDAEVQVRASQDAAVLSVVPGDGVTVELLDEDGVAWARVAAAAVEVDLSSPAFHAATNAAGRVPDPLPATHEAWTVIGRDGTFQWFEHRLHPAALDVPPTVLASDEAQDVATWSVPVRVDGRDVALTGRLRHVPVTGQVVARLLGDGEVSPGVTVEVAPGPVPVVFLRNDGSTPVTVLGREGAPYAVIGPDGVAVNLSSATRAEQRLADGAIDAAPGTATFRQVSATPAHAWLETRAALPGLVPDEDVRSSGRTVRLFAWSVPVEVAGTVTSIDGETVWVPLQAPASTTDGPLRPVWLVAAGVTALLVVTAVRRRVG